MYILDLNPSTYSTQDAAPFEIWGSPDTANRVNLRKGCLGALLVYESMIMYATTVPLQPKELSRELFSRKMRSQPFAVLQAAG